MQTSKPEYVIIGGLFAGSFALCLMASSGWHWLTGFSLWGLGETLRTRRKLEYVEVFRGCTSYAQDLIGEVNEVALPVSDRLGAIQRSITVSALRQLPLGDRLADQFIASQGLDTDWFQGFERRSAIVCGESKDGKSFLLQWRVARYLENHPDGELLICDPDYGSSHAGAKPNDWFRLPVGRVVQIETVEITNAIYYVSNEVSRRVKVTAESVKAGKPKPEFKPLLLVIDEWISHWDSLDEPTQETTLTALTNIVNRGIKQGGVTFVLGLHDLSVGSTGLPRALLRKLECILLYRASQATRNYDNLESPRGQVEGAIARMTNLPREVRGLRPCVLWADKELTVKAIPHLDLGDIAFVAPSEVDEDEAWLESIWTPNFAATITAKMSDRLHSGKRGTGVVEYWLLAGEPEKRAVNTNRRYQLFKSKIESLHSSMASNPDQGSRKSKVDSGSREVVDTQDFQLDDNNPFTSHLLDQLP